MLQGTALVPTPWRAVTHTRLQNNAYRQQRKPQSTCPTFSNQKRKPNGTAISVEIAVQMENFSIRKSNNRLVEWLDLDRLLSSSYIGQIQVGVTRKIHSRVICWTTNTLQLVVNMNRCHTFLTTSSAFIECRAYGSVAEPSVKAARRLPHRCHLFPREAERRQWRHDRLVVGTLAPVCGRYDVDRCF